MPVGAITIPRAPSTAGSGGYLPLAPGLYLAEVMDVEKKEFKGVEQLSITLKVLTNLTTNKPANGRLWESLPIYTALGDPNAKMAWKIDRFLTQGLGQTAAAIDKATKDGNITLNPDKWVGKQVAVKTTIFEGRNGPMASIDSFMTPEVARQQVERATGAITI